MTPRSQELALQKYQDALESTTPSESSRAIAWVSAAGAIVWGIFFAVMSGPPSDGALTVVLFVSAHHLGQAIASAVSWKIGGAYAWLALAGQLAVAVTVLVVNLSTAPALFFLTTPMICSACAVVLLRRALRQNVAVPDDPDGA